MKLSDKELQVVSALCHKQVALEAEVERQEERLKATKRQLDFVRQVEIPNAMSELGLSNVTLTSGAKIEVKQKYYASIPVDRKEEAFSWLEEHKLDGVIKNVVKCEFGKGENTNAKEAMKELTSLGFCPSQDISVHPMTLKALVKDLFERGVEFPMEVFGAGTVSESKVVLPK